MGQGPGVWTKFNQSSDIFQISLLVFSHGGSPYFPPSDTIRLDQTNIPTRTNRLLPGELRRPELGDVDRAAADRPREDRRRQPSSDRRRRPQPREIRY